MATKERVKAIEDFKARLEAMQKEAKALNMGNVFSGIDDVLCDVDEALDEAVVEAVAEGEIPRESYDGE